MYMVIQRLRMYACIHYYIMFYIYVCLYVMSGFSLWYHMIFQKITAASPTYSCTYISIHNIKTSTVYAIIFVLTFTQKMAVAITTYVYHHQITNFQWLKVKLTVGFVFQSGRF